MHLALKIIATLIAFSLTFAGTLQIYNSGWWRGSLDGNAAQAFGTFLGGCVLITIVWLL